MYRTYSSANATKAQHTTNTHGIWYLSPKEIFSATCKLSPPHLIKDRTVRKSGEGEWTWYRRWNSCHMRKDWKAVLGEHKVEKTQLRFKNQRQQSKWKTVFEGFFFKTHIPSTRTGRSLMKLKGLKELDHVHYHTASGKLLKITHGVLETCRFKDKLTNSRSINTEWREAAGRNWLISVLQLLQMLRQFRQNRPTAGAQAHVLSLNSTSCCCCYKQNTGQGETLLSSESSSSTPAQN